MQNLNKGVYTNYSTDPKKRENASIIFYFLFMCHNNSML